MDLSSNAFNFSEHINSGVDPRTGSYSFSINLGAFLAHKGSGCNVNLQLSHNSSSIKDLGFSRGWALNVSSYSKYTNILSLSNGQRFKIYWNPTKKEYDLYGRRLKDIRVFYLASPEQLLVVYKGGKQEFIDYHRGNLVKTMSPNGLYTFYDYWYNDSEHVLWQVRDSDDLNGTDGRRIVLDTWSDPWLTSVTHNLDGIAFSSFLLEKDGGGAFKRLCNILIPEHSISTQIEYQYADRSGHDLITKVRHASGLCDELTYVEEGFALPDGAPLVKIPMITEHYLRVGKNQPDTYTTYRYSDTNYLGFASDVKWTPGEDTLFKAREDYKYTSEETIHGAGNVKTIKRTYNKYHLNETNHHFVNSEPTLTEHFHYFAELDQGIESQPENYSFIKEKVITHHFDGESRSYITSYNYDEWGNILFEKDPSGNITTYDYYPISGEPGKCPPDPHGMRSCLKSESYNPANTKIHKFIRYEYESLTRFDKPERFILLSKISNPGHTVEYTYYSSNTDPYLHGRLESETLFVNDYFNRTTFRYEFTKKGLKVITHVLAENDNNEICESKSGEVKRYEDGLVIESFSYTYSQSNTSPDIIINKMSFDSLGRQLKDTVCVGTIHEFSLNYSYDVGPEFNTLTSINSSGHKVVQMFNSAGNLIRVLTSDHFFKMRLQKEFFYNDLGLLKLEHEYDWLRNSQGEYIEHKVISTSYEYDSLSNLSKVTYPSGQINTINQNPVKLTNVLTVEGIVTCKTYYDLSGLENKIEYLDGNGEIIASSTYEYDGFGNVINVQDSQGSITTFSYDNNDRVSLITKSNNNQLVTHKYSYAAFTIDNLPTLSEVSYDGKTYVMGERQYDGFGRITYASIGGIEQKLSYDGSSNMVLLKEHSESSIKYQNNLYLGTLESVSAMQDGQESQLYSYHYEALTGRLTHCSSQINEYTYLYDNLGDIKNEIATFGDLRLHTSRVESLLGRVLFSTDYMGNLTEYKYNDNLDLSTICTIAPGPNGELIITTHIEYDNKGRPIYYKIVSSNNILEIELIFDPLETFRTVTLNNKIIYKQSHVYDNMLIVKRTTTTYTNNDANTTIETMDHDVHQRLVFYSVEGNDLPSTVDNLKVFSQSFTYDPKGNVTEVYSIFSDSSTDLASFTFDDNDPSGTRLSSVSHTHPSIHSKSFIYDSVGNIVSDGSEHQLNFSPEGKLTNIFDTLNQQVASYRYDPFGRIVQIITNNEIKTLLYESEKLVNELTGDMIKNYQEFNGIYSSITSHNQSNSFDVQLSILNQQNTPIGTINNDDTHINSQFYTSYGESFISNSENTSK